MAAPLRQAAWRMILPELRKIVKEELEDEIKGLRGEVMGEFKALHSEIRRLDEKIVGEIRRLDEKIGGLDKRLDVVQRLAVVEAKLREYEEKASRKD